MISKRKLLFILYRKFRKMCATHCNNKGGIICALRTAHLEIEQESCGSVRNIIRFRRFVVLTLPTRLGV